MQLEVVVVALAVVNAVLAAAVMVTTWLASARATAANRESVARADAIHNVQMVAMLELSAKIDAMSRPDVIKRLWGGPEPGPRDDAIEG